MGDWERNCWPERDGLPADPAHPWLTQAKRAAQQASPRCLGANRLACSAAHSRDRTTLAVKG